MYFERYGPKVVPMILRLGGGPVLRSGGITPIVGDEQVDELILVRYPTAEAFAAMIASPDYRAVSHFRTEAIELGEVWPFSFGVSQD